MRLSLVSHYDPQSAFLSPHGNNRAYIPKSFLQQRAVHLFRILLALVLHYLKSSNRQGKGRGGYFGGSEEAGCDDGCDYRFYHLLAVDVAGDKESW